MANLYKLKEKISELYLKILLEPECVLHYKRLIDAYKTHRMNYEAEAFEHLLVTIFGEISDLDKDIDDSYLDAK